jgi:TPR repeat protein/rhodanese-related sulfurtransferase
MVIRPFRNLFASGKTQTSRHMCIDKLKSFALSHLGVRHLLAYKNWPATGLFLLCGFIPSISTAQDCNIKIPESFSICQKMALSNPVAGVIVGKMYKSGIGTAQNESAAVTWFRKSAEQGHAEAQLLLGVAYYSGEGVAKDAVQAVEWFRKSAEQGELTAQFNLGIAHDDGEGVAKDATQAVMWYRKAAEQGHAGAQSNLGDAYYNGKGVDKDATQAVMWYRKAAEQGDARAQFILGYVYSTGNGINKDALQSVMWFRKAAASGNKLAMNMLGQIYAAGLGVPKDEAASLHWFKKTVEGDIYQDKFCQEFKKDTPDIASCYARHRDYGLAVALGLGGREPDPVEAKRIFSIISRDDGDGSWLNTPLWPTYEARKKILEPPKNTAAAALPIRHTHTEGDADACGLSDNSDTGLAPERFEPRPLPGVRYSRAFDVLVMVKSADAQHKQNVKAMVHGAADVYATCGIQLRVAKIAAYSDKTACDEKKLINNAAPAIPVFVNPTRGEKYVVPQGGKNGVDMGESTDSGVFAHELGHVFGLRHPADFEPTVMAYDLLQASSRFNEAQCAQLKASARMYALPVPADVSYPDPASVTSDVRAQWQNFSGESLKKLVARLMDTNRHAAAFYLLRNLKHKQGMMRDYSESLPRIAMGLGLPLREVIKMYEHAHHWRGEQGWVTDKTVFDTQSPPDIFWNPEITEAKLASQSHQDLADFKKGRLSDWVKWGWKQPAANLDPKTGDDTWAYPPMWAARQERPIAIGELMPLDTKGSARISDDLNGAMEYWVRGGDLYLVSVGLNERRVRGFYPNFFNVWRGNNLAELRKSPFYNMAWEDAKANPKSEPIRSDVAPTQTLRNGNYGAPTPASLPGASVITPLETWQAIVAGYGRPAQERPVMLSAVDNVVTLPGAYDLSFAGGGGTLDDEVQKRLGELMAKIAPNKQQMLVSYCHHNHCWLSYNLTLRLAALGYTNLRWLRDGLDGWVASTLPVGILGDVNAVAVAM